MSLVLTVIALTYTFFIAIPPLGGGKMSKKEC